MAEAESAPGLGGVKLLDLVDERAIYGSKLLADLGADVVRVELPGGESLRGRGPFKGDVPGPTNSLWHAFFASNRNFMAVDSTTDDGRRQLNRLLSWADIVIDSGALAEARIDLETELKRRPELVGVRVTSFGPEGPWKSYLAPDLIANALGGLAATTGDIDTPPLKGFGEIAFYVSGSYAAIAALSALRHARETGEGQLVDVNVHECIASCLEHVLMWYWYHDLLPLADGPVLPRRGALHWSDGYDVIAAKGGSIMVTPTPDLNAQIAWLAEEGAHQDLLEVDLSDPSNLIGLLKQITDVMRPWAAEKDVEQFFFEAQRRHMPYGWVLPLDKVGDNPQLAARHWWQPYDIDGEKVQGPGPPYRFSAIRQEIATYSEPGAATESILAEIGWENDA